MKRLATLVAPVMAVLLFIFLLGGGTYDLLKNPAPWASLHTGEQVFVYPLGDEQFLLESLVVMSLLITAFAGFFSLLQSVKHLRTPKVSYFYMTIGALMIGFSFVCLDYLSFLKS